MKKLIPLSLLLLPAVIFSFGGSCGGNETYEWYIQAQVNIVTPTTEDSFSFDERCYLFSDEIDEETYWEIDAIDRSMPFGIYIIWKESFITGPGTFQAFEGYSNLYIIILRADPIEPGWFIYYSVEEGIITFTQVGYQSGDIIEGTFDQLRVYDWELEEYIEVDDGTFRCQVK